MLTNVMLNLKKPNDFDNQSNKIKISLRDAKLLVLLIISIFPISNFSLLPKKIGELYVGGMSSKYAVLKSVKNLQDLHNKIIECKYENGGWVFLRERTDKAFPNSFDTVKSKYFKRL